MINGRPSTGSSPPIRSRNSVIHRSEPPRVGVRYLVDNSVLQRLPTSPEVQVAIRSLLDDFGYSARSATEYLEANRRLRISFFYLSLSADIDQIILDIRAALWHAGTGRAAGVIDRPTHRLAADRPSSPC